ncbi:MAG: ImmA/IrrE family metallo-endopeptidase [Bdellovibrionota bacterium]
MSVIYARRIIEGRGITDPKEIDLESIANSLEVTIEEADLDGCDGILQMIPDPKCGIITVKKSIKEPGQKRFVIAHELGHYETPNQPSQDYHCSTADMSPKGHRFKPEEREANEFAAELLMPEKLFKPRMKNKRPSMDLIKSLAGDFQTTLTATLRRFVKLTDYRCAMISSVDGKVEYFVPSGDFHHSISNGTPLHPNSYAIDFFKSGRIENKMHSVFANTWITSDRISRNACIYEHSIAQPSYKSVLTLLWISQDIDGLHFPVKN